MLQIDGFNLRTGWCILTARSRGRVIAYQWCSRESKAAWDALLQRIPAPVVTVCDGGSGLHAALAEHWPDTRVQRCLVHLQRNVRKYVTTRSRSNAGKALWQLALKLTRVRTVADAETWTGLFLAWEGQYLNLTKARTYRKNATIVPDWVKPTQQWWYTHQRLRSGYFVLRKQIEAGTVFTYLDPVLVRLEVSSTTNDIEGGTNSQMRLVLLHHRGMIEQHQRRAIEWWLYMHSENPAVARVLTQPQTDATKSKQAQALEPEPEQTFYGTGLDEAEGLWIRKGWAGRS